jgi:hypothetical protein
MKVVVETQQGLHGQLIVHFTAATGEVLKRAKQHSQSAYLVFCSVVPVV